MVICYILTQVPFFFFFFFFFTQTLGSACWVILLGYFKYFYPGAVFFFLPKCWVQLVGSFYWVILTPTDGLSLSPVKLLNNAAVKSMSF